MDRLLAGKLGAGMNEIARMQPATTGHLARRPPNRDPIHRDRISFGKVPGRTFMLRLNRLAHHTRHPVQHNLRARLQRPERDHDIVSRMNAEDGMHVRV